ncbi:hypothetical protein OQA88_10235 [Cercophora sp. LCS_1]
MSPSLYRPFTQPGEIRLLTILPGPANSPLICHLTTQALSSTPDYELVSYIRHSTNKTLEIVIDNLPFPAQENAVAALHRLRLRSVPRHVWVDAICINRDDHEERERHILLMGRILAQARHVCVCLGESAEPKGKDKGWAGAREVVDSAWWEQVWSLPEVILGKKIVLITPEDEITWDTVERAVKERHNDVPNTHSTFHGFNRLREKWASGHWDVSIYQLLELSRHLDCEDPRDRIYALFGLEPSLTQFEIAPKYDVPAADIHLDFTRKMIQRTGRLDILNCVRPRCGTTPTESEPSPSWVPTWSSTLNEPVPFLNWSETSPNYAAGNLMKAQLRKTNGPKTLILSGVRFDQIAELGNPWHPTSAAPPTSRHGITPLDQWEQIALTTHLSCPYNGPSGRKDALWRTYIADSPADNDVPKHHETFIECWYDRVGWSSQSSGDMEKAWAKHMTDLLHKSQQTKNPLRKIKNTLDFSRHGREEYEAYCRRIYNACAHRRLLVSKRGYIGLAPWSTEVGDVIVVLHGGRTPFLLRPGSEPGVYEFVGECFVYGIMGGEGLTWEHAIAAARDFRIV